MRSSLSIKLLLRISIAVGLCILFLGIFEFYLTGQKIEKQLDDTTSQVAGRLANSLVMPLWNIDRDVIESIITTEMQNRNVYAVAVRDELLDLHMVAKSRDPNWNIINAKNLEKLHGARIIDRPIIFGDNNLGTVRVYVTDRFSRKVLVESVTNLAIRLTVLLLMVIAVVVIFINVQVTNPIYRLSRSCRKVAQGNFGVTLDTSRKDEIGSLAGSFAHMRDAIQEKIAILSNEIGERKKKEAELSRLRAYLNNIVDSMPSLLISVDIHTRVTQWNREAQKFTLLSKSEVLGRPLAEVLPWLERKVAKIEETIREKINYNDQHFTVPTDAGERIFAIAAYPLVSESVDGAVVRLDDITDRVKLEEVMVQTEKMMSVGGLAAGMAHEINNPLAGIMQSVQVIRNRLSSKLSKNAAIAEECGLSMQALECYVERREITIMLDSIMHSGERASQIINNMLSFSRKSSSQYMYCNINTLLDRTVELAGNDYDLKKKYDFKNIEIVKHYGQSLPEVRCDGSTIQQVFFNILKNAAQAMAMESVEQAAREDMSRSPRIILRTYQDGGFVVIDIEDNGRGMDEVTRRRIFEPFFTTKNVGVGTGLGLSVSFFIIKDNHKGEIEVQTSPGKGSLFRVSLPLAEA